MDKREVSEVGPKVFGKVTEEERLAWQEQALFMYHRSLWDNRGMWYIFLRHWCGGKEIFRREFAYPFRRVTKSVKQLHKQILHFGWEKRNHVYLSIYEFESFEPIPKEQRKVGSDRVERPVYSRPIINRLAVEFDQAVMCPQCQDVIKKRGKFWDCKKCGWTDNQDAIGSDAGSVEPYIQSLSDVWREVLEVWKHVGKATVLFTGGRGFQMYHPLEELITAKALADRQRQIMNNVPTKSLDDGHIGDVARVYRIPYTLHVSKLRFCIPVRPDWSLKEILRRSVCMQVPEVVEPVQFKKRVMSDEEIKKAEEVVRKSSRRRD